MGCRGTGPARSVSQVCRGFGRILLAHPRLGRHVATYSRYPRLKLARLVIWRLRHSKLRRMFHRSVADEVSRAHPTGWIVDVGSGPGLLAMQISRAHPGVRVVNVDVTRAMLLAARASGRLDVVRATADSLPFRDGEFDTVVSTATLKDWARRQAGLGEIARILKAGGSAFVYDFVTSGPGSQPSGFIRRFGLLSEILRRRVARQVSFSLEDLNRLAAGLRAPGREVRVDAIPDFGAAKMIITKAPAA